MPAARSATCSRSTRTISCRCSHTPSPCPSSPSCAAPSPSPARPTPSHLTPVCGRSMGPRLQLHTSQFLWRHPGWSQANMGASVGARYAKADAAERAAQREAREAPQDVAQLGWHRWVRRLSRRLASLASHDAAARKKGHRRNDQRDWAGRDAPRRDQGYVLFVRLPRPGVRADVGGARFAQVAARREGRLARSRGQGADCGGGSRRGAAAARRRCTLLREP